MSDKEDRKSARKTLKTAKKGSAAYKEARGILSGDSPEEREYRKTTGKNKNRTNPYKDIIGSTGYVMGKFPETMMDIEDGIGFGKLYEGEMKGRGKKSLEKTDEDYSGDRPTKKKMGGGYMKKNMKVGGSLERAKTHHELTEGYETHKGKSKPVEHPSRGRLGAQRIKNRIDEAARRANKRSEKAMRTDNNIITKLGSYMTPVGGVLTGAQPKKTSPVPKPKRKPPVTKKPVNEDKIRESLRIRKHGGKVSKAMGGGKVYKYGQGGGLGKTMVKRISKNETNGNKIVDNCYKNYD